MIVGVGLCWAQAGDDTVQQQYTYRSYRLTCLTVTVMSAAQPIMKLREEGGSKVGLAANAVERG